MARKRDDIVVFGFTRFLPLCGHLQALEGNHPRRTLQIKVRPFGGGDGAGADEGQGEQLERITDQIVAAPLINLDLAKELAEFDGIGDRGPMFFLVFGEARLESDIGEGRRAILGPFAMRLCKLDDVASGRVQPDAGRVVDDFQYRQQVERVIEINDRHRAEPVRSFFALRQITDHPHISRVCLADLLQ